MPQHRVVACCQSVPTPGPHHASVPLPTYLRSSLCAMCCCAMCCCAVCVAVPYPLRRQVFVANPNKPQAIVDILTNNREKLLKYLEDFHTDRGEGTGRQQQQRQRLLQWLLVVVAVLSSRSLFVQPLQAEDDVCLVRVHGYVAAMPGTARKGQFPALLMVFGCVLQQITCCMPTAGPFEHMCAIPATLSCLIRPSLAADEDEQFKEEKAVIIREISLLGREQQQQQQPPAAGTPAQQQQEQQEQQQPALAAPQQQQQPGDLAPQAAAAAAGHQEGPSAAAAGSAPAAAGSNEGVS